MRQRLATEQMLYIKSHLVYEYMMESSAASIAQASPESVHPTTWFRAAGDRNMSKWVVPVQC